MYTGERKIHHAASELYQVHTSNAKRTYVQGAKRRALRVLKHLNQVLAESSCYLCAPPCFGENPFGSESQGEGLILRVSRYTLKNPGNKTSDTVHARPNCPPRPPPPPPTPTLPSPRACPAGVQPFHHSPLISSVSIVPPQKTWVNLGQV